jgi:hypothetical protein
LSHHHHKLRLLALDLGLTRWKTRHTSEEQALANQARYQETKTAKQQRRQRKIDCAKMTSTLSTQTLLKQLQPVGLFTGALDQDPSLWLQDMDDLFDATQTTSADRRRLLPLCFGDDIKKWYRLEERESDYNAFRRTFVTTFTSAAHKLQLVSRLNNRRQGPSEPVQTYFYDVLSLCKRFNPAMDKDEQIVHLLKGLRPSLRERLIIHNPDTCQEFLDQAKRVEVAVNITQLHEPRMAEVDSATEETTAAIGRLSVSNTAHAPMYSNRQPNTASSASSSSRFPQRRTSFTSSRSTSSQLVCYNCNGVGHYARQCPSHLN